MFWCRRDVWIWMFETEFSYRLYRLIAPVWISLITPSSQIGPPPSPLPVDRKHQTSWMIEIDNSEATRSLEASKINIVLRFVTIT
jgi:hypothetical protein